MTTPSDIASPCIGVCQLDSQGEYCMGCYRTLDEIARWRQFDEAKKQAILDRLTRHKQDKIQMHDVSFEPYKPVL